MIILSLPPKPTGEAGTAITIKLDPPDETAKEQEKLDFQATFVDAGSYLVWGVRPVLEKLIAEHKKELIKYNRMLGRKKIPYRVRLTHTVTRKGNRYVYCGRYLYTKDNKYVDKLSAVVLRAELKDRWSKELIPPKNPLEGLSYKIFIANGQETDNVVVPYELMHDPRFFHIFSKYTRSRLGGL